MSYPMDYIVVLVVLVALFASWVVVVVKSFKRDFFSDELIKYEVEVLSMCRGYEANYLKEMQDDGWKIAGGVTLVDRGVYGIDIIIPLKREIKQNNESATK